VFGGTTDFAGGMADFGGVAGQGLGAVVHFADQLPQRGQHLVERAKQAVRRCGDAHRQVAGSDLLHRQHGRRRFAAQLADDAAPDQPAGQPLDQQQDAGNAAEPEQIAAEGGVDVVDVDAGADDPFPGGKALDVGELGHGLFRAWF